MLHPRPARGAIAWGDWARLALGSLARVAVLVVLGGLFWAAAPAAIGWLPTTVMSDSMSPRIVAGDVVVAAPATPTTLGIGRVLLVDDPDAPADAPRLRLHRMVGVADDGIVTRGDANPADDSSHVAERHVRGVAVLRIPWVGSPVLWAKTGQWMPLAATGAAFAALLGLTTIDARLRREPGPRAGRSGSRILSAAVAGAIAGGRTGTDTDTADAASGSATSVPRRARLRRIGPAVLHRAGPAALVTGSAAVVTLALVASTGAHAAYAAPTSNPTSGWAGAADFVCWPTAAPADNPYFYYRFDEPATQTTATDSSANGRTGTLTGVSRTPGTCPAAGASPSAGLTGSASSRVTWTPNAATLAPNVFSLEAWFQTSSQTGGRIVGFGSSASGSSGTYDRHLYLTNTGAVVFGVYPGTAKTISSAVGKNDGRWHHVIATLDSTGMKLYLDGGLVAGDSTVTTAQASTGWWRVGWDNLGGWPNTPTTAALTGNLDNVAVYGTALGTTQVAAHYAVGH